MTGYRLPGGGVGSEFFEQYRDARTILTTLERRFEDVPYRISLCWVECDEEGLAVNVIE